MFFINKMFLHCFSQRHVSTVAMGHLQVDQFFLCKTNHTISIANCMVSTLPMSHLQVDIFFFARQTIQLAILFVWFALQKNWSTWRWLIARGDTYRWEKQCKNILLIRKNIKQVVLDYVLSIYFMSTLYWQLQISWRWHYVMHFSN